MLPSSALPARRVRQMLSPLIEQAVKESDADRYRKSFPASAHLWMLLLHTMSANTSLRQSHAQRSADPSLGSMLGMERWISYSQLARSSSSRPAEYFERLLVSLLRRARRGRANGQANDLFRKVHLLDSTFFPLGTKASPWSVRGGHRGAGVRLQAALDLSRMMPTTLKMTTIGANDAAALGAWDLSGLCTPYTNTPTLTVTLPHQR